MQAPYRATYPAPLLAHVRPTLVLLVASMLAACGGDDPVSVGPPGIRILSSPGPDTVEAVLAIPLSIEVRGTDGLPLAGADVVFRGVKFGDASPEVSAAHAGTIDPARFGEFLREATDGRGRLSIQLRLGSRTPSGRLAIDVLNPDGITPAFKDTLSFTITPGAPSAVRMAPRDTSVYVDGTVQMRGTVVDRHGNPRSEPVTYEAGPHLAVSESGVVSPSAYARSFVVARSAAFGQDTGYVSVVPRGRVLALRSTGGSGPFVLANLDGSRMTTIPTIQGGFEAAPAWAPDGRRFVYSTFTLTRETGGELFIGDSTGVAAPLLPADAFRNAAYARYSRDGQWIYFSGQGQDGIFALWRVRPDGSDAEPLGVNLGGDNVDWRPDPSPDGTQVVFTILGAPSGSGGWGVRVFTMGTAQTSPWIVPGLVARWSSSGERIAVMPNGPGPLVVVNADGSSPRTVATEDASFGKQSFDWSPDGQWLILRLNTRLELLHVDSGLQLPLTWSNVLVQPTWQP